MRYHSSFSLILDQEFHKINKLWGWLLFTEIALLFAIKKYKSSEPIIKGLADNRCTWKQLSEEGEIQIIIIQALTTRHRMQTNYDQSHLIQ